VFESGWVKLNPAWNQPALAEKWVKLRDLRNEANKVLEQARSAKDIGSSLEAKLIINVSDAEWQTVLKSLNPTTGGNGVDELRYLLLTSQVEVSDRLEGESISMAKADGTKCDRCWNYSTHVGQSEAHPLLCDRCIEVVEG
jgi:isoleucyl-tRNA synthetase